MDRNRTGLLLAAVLAISVIASGFLIVGAAAYDAPTEVPSDELVENETIEVSNDTHELFVDVEFVGNESELNASDELTVAVYENDTEEGDLLDDETIEPDESHSNETESFEWTGDDLDLVDGEAYHVVVYSDDPDVVEEVHIGTLEEFLGGAGAVDGLFGDISAALDGMNTWILAIIVVGVAWIYVRR